VQRRSFLALLTGATGVGLGACRSRGLLAPAGPTCPGEARVSRGALLGPELRATLEAACARLIPTDQDPGAAEAGVADYLESELATARFSRFRSEIEAGLRKLDELARRGGGAGFAALPAAKQDELLALCQRGTPMGKKVRSQHFFMILLIFSLEGYFGDPVYGGNRGEVGWRLLGFTPREPHPTCPYRGQPWQGPSGMGGGGDPPEGSPA
jgi:gluconate 2-dehydrogenase gamma chain